MRAGAHLVRVRARVRVRVRVRLRVRVRVRERDAVRAGAHHGGRQALVLRTQHVDAPLRVHEVGERHASHLDRYPDGAVRAGGTEACVVGSKAVGSQ